MADKKWWQSKTIWINVGAIILTLVPMIQEYTASGKVLTGLAVLNLILRAVTKTSILPIKDDKKDET